MSQSHFLGHFAAGMSQSHFLGHFSAAGMSQSHLLGSFTRRHVIYSGLGPRQKVAVGVGNNLLEQLFAPAMVAGPIF